MRTAQQHNSQQVGHHHFTPVPAGTPVPKEFTRRKLRVVGHKPLATPEPVKVTVTR